MSIPLSLHPKCTTVDTFTVVLFNARSVNDPLKTAEISTFITDNQVDILFLAESWLQVDILFLTESWLQVDILFLAESWLQVDILFLTESWLQVDILFLAESWLRQQADEAKCSDLAPVCYSSVPFHTAKYLTSTSPFPFQHPSFKAARISLALFPDLLHFVCLYRPPPSRKNKLTDAMFLNEFPDLLDFCNNRSGKCIILKNMNVHFGSPKNPCTAKMLSYLDMLSFSQAVNEPTHECGHTLDWVMFRSEDNVLRTFCVCYSLNRF